MRLLLRYYQARATPCDAIAMGSMEWRAARLVVEDFHNAKFGDLSSPPTAKTIISVDCRNA